MRSKYPWLTFVFDIFKKQISEFNIIFKVSCSAGSNFVTRLRVGLCHLLELKFRDNIRDSVNSVCYIGKGTETTKRFFVCCKVFVHEKQALLHNMRDIDPNIFPLIENALTQIQLYGDTKFKDISNIWPFNLVTELILLIKRFDNLLIL